MMVDLPTIVSPTTTIFTNRDSISFDFALGCRFYDVVIY